MSKKEYLREVTSSVQKESTAILLTQAKKRKSVYNTNLNVLGLTVPQMRKINKTFSFYQKNPDVIMEIWNYIWKKSSIFEIKSQAILYYQMRSSDLVFEKHWNVLASWSLQLDNWEHSDRLSDIYSSLLEKNQTKIYPFLQKWNEDKNPWYRRQSIVSLLYYSNSRKKIIAKSKIFPLIKNLLKDEDYYVQKGVGWTLREAGNVYPNETLAFIEKNLSLLSSIAFTTSVEKVNKTTKEKFKEKRKQFRKKS